MARATAGCLSSSSSSGSSSQLTSRHRRADRAARQGGSAAEPESHRLPLATKVGHLVEQQRRKVTRGRHVAWAPGRGAWAPGRPPGCATTKAPANTFYMSLISTTINLQQYCPVLEGPSGEQLPPVSAACQGGLVKRSRSVAPARALQTQCSAGCSPPTRGSSRCAGCRRFGLLASLFVPAQT